MLRRLESLVIREEERVACRVSEEWVRSMALKGVRYRYYAK